MIVGRNPRLPVIGDTVLLRVGERRGVGIIVCAVNVRIPLLNRHGLKQVKRLALWHALDNVDQHDVAMFLRRHPMRRP